MDKMLTIQDVAANLQVKARTVRDWIAQGKIAFVRLPGGDYRIKEANYMNWLETRTVKNRKN